MIIRKGGDRSTNPIISLLLLASKLKCSPLKCKCPLLKYEAFWKGGAKRNEKKRKALNFQGADKQQKKKK